MSAFWQETLDDDGILIARYVNPPLNYYTDAAVSELGELVATSWRREEVRVVVLAGGIDGIFITHFSPEEILAGVQQPELIVRRGAARNRVINVILDGFAELPAPVIAALNGDATGFGFELALACDLRIGQTGDVLYGFPEVRMGILPAGGGTQRLARLVGLPAALDIVLRSRVMPPELALQYGLVGELADDAMSRAIQIAREIAELPPLAVAVAKRALHRGADAPLAVGLTIESDASVRAKLGPDVAAALQEYVNLSPELRRRWLVEGLR